MAKCKKKNERFRKDVFYDENFENKMTTTNNAMYTPRERKKKSKNISNIAHMSVLCYP